MIRRLRIKFVAINMAIVSVMLCVILGLIFYFTGANLERESIRMLRSIAEHPFQLGVPSELGEDVRLPFFTLRVGPHGELISTGGGYYDLSDDAFLGDLIEVAFSSPRQLGVIEDYRLRYYRAESPLSHCLVFADISSEQATLEGLTRICLVIGALGFLAFLGISILLSKWAVRPVELAWQRQQQFVAAASHELKTPLTVIRTDAELLQDPAADSGQRAKFLSDILTMSRQMGRLVEQLLELARADSGGAEAELRPVDLSRLAAQAVLPFEPVFFEQGLTLHTQLEEGVTVHGQAEALRQVVEILLDNAQKYARPGGSAWVTLRRCGRSRCLLTVADQGEPLSPEELRRIFERFYRGDRARSRTGSFGLGLSIAQRIVGRHRGRIWAESAGGVNRFHVELPCI